MRLLFISLLVEEIFPPLFPDFPGSFFSWIRVSTKQTISDQIEDAQIFMVKRIVRSFCLTSYMARHLLANSSTKQ